MENFDSKYALTGKLLVAMPTLNESDCFSHSVVYVCSHGKSGAMGIIVNKQMDKFSFSDLTFQLPVKDYEALNSVKLYIFYESLEHYYLITLYHSRKKTEFEVPFRLQYPVPALTN